MTPSGVAIILAGRRGEHDPVCAAEGVRHKGLVPVAGTAMIERVIDAIIETGRFDRVQVVADDAGLFADLPRIAALRAQGRLVFSQAGPSPSLSTRQAVEGLDGAWPALLTTCDHPLLRAEMIDHMFREAEDGADICVGVVDAHLIRAAYPDMRRTFLRFRSDTFSGANLFLLRTPGVIPVLDFWQRVERDRKRPHRMFAALGWTAVAKMALGRLSLNDALGRVRQLTGARVQIIRLPFPEASIDVDKPEDLQTVNEIIVGQSVPVPSTAVVDS